MPHKQFKSFRVNLMERKKTALDVWTKKIWIDLDNSPHIPFFNPEYKAMERIYAHFFTSMYSYIDLYIMHLSREIMTKLNDKDYFEFLTGFKPMKNPKERINYLINYFSICKRDKLNEILKGKKWEDTLVTLIEVRDTISHRNPIVTQDILKEKFPILLKQVQQLIDTNMKLEEKSTDPMFTKLFSETLFLFETILLFELIMRNCYSFLALIDQALFKSDFARNKK